jgi:hypothetical protein
MRALAALTSRHRPTTTIAERIALLSASSCASAAWTHKSMFRPVEAVTTPAPALRCG